MPYTTTAMADSIQPQISVIMPVYNGSKYLKSAINSILSQSFSNFEFIIIDDGSSDNSIELIKGFNDPRIILIENKENQGVVKTLNIAITKAKGNFIARMDCDDIAHKHRLLFQFTEFQKNPSIGIIGCDIFFIDENSKVIGKGVLPPTQPNEIKWSLLRRCCVYHPTIMARREVLEKHCYPSNYLHSEDYALWLELSKKVNFKNLKERLYYFRKHDESITTKFCSVATDSMIRALSENSYLEVSDIEKRLVTRALRFPWEGCPPEVISLVLGEVYKNYTKTQRRDYSKYIEKSFVSFSVTLILFTLLKYKRVPLKTLRMISNFKVSKFTYLEILIDLNVNVYNRFFWRRYLPWKKRVTPTM